MNDKSTKQNWDSFRAEHGCKLIRVNLVEKNETWQCQNDLEVIHSKTIISDSLFLSIAILFSGLIISFFLKNTK